ncbi:hypothetical protein GLOIN_2v1773409 [Rhizophagus irregularis DAOM 181602=DAOM 197198]|uniref:Uncharacterized protein n=1 Tax=Rhizophagus irregularis (strain DAOM 181602 / DAOM 197198 / MUCL 43194) TaxID=747089 RepID=A0A2P4Q4P6_RHIID|nr:hypothetical protein GLOIN_2v1773409 [Rhizophagus irregularis DAOM 181602=DAOM 197198]POG72606.1 hypothetical protein GLOIN_2v1773409 [Rhizophagus irregularis DAOM 181602=DAOM 197198]|eukprot:XP_025179472.1 hypothetical protein GLOIN_2v1773409 [Rhizophagus irregularis DAOM 181602=DAOM 197198]
MYRKNTNVLIATHKNKKAKKKLEEYQKIGCKGDWILRIVNNSNKNGFRMKEVDKN